MKLKLAIPALAASMLISGAALADDGPRGKNKNRSSATTVTGGVTAAGPNGAVAGGAAATQAEIMQQRRDRRAIRGQVSLPNQATTSTSGSVYTDRRTGSAAINTNGAASGDGSVRSSSEGEVFSSTTRDGSQADAYGVSEAEANEPQDPQS